MAETREQYNARKRRERAARVARDPEGELVKSRAANAKWEAAHPNYFRDKAAEWYRDHPEQAAASHKTWVAGHAKEWAEYMRGWKAGNQAHVADYQKRWEDANPGNVRTKHKMAKYKMAFRG
jgi:hypothetical protein